MDRMTVTHEVNFTTEKQYRTDVFSADYHYKWALNGKCDECGWFGYVTRNGNGPNGAECSIGEGDRRYLLLQHDDRRGLFAIPKRDGKVGNDIFMVGDDGQTYELRFRNGDWDYVPV